MQPKLVHRFYSNHNARRLLNVDLVFEKRDCYIGVYWTPSGRAPIYHDSPIGDVVVAEAYGVDVYVVLVPTLPIRVQWRTQRDIDDQRLARFAEAVIFASVWDEIMP